MIILTLKFRKDTWRNLRWKFNSSLLSDTMYVDCINDVIKSVLEEYAALPYERVHLTHMPRLTSSLLFLISYSWTFY